MGRTVQFLTTTAGALCAVAQPVWAQSSTTSTSEQSETSQAPSGPTSPDQAGLEDIVVTAQRRQESAQSVPIAVAAFSGDQLQRMGVKSTSDLATAIPGLVVTPSGARAPMTLRGVGNNAVSTSPSVLMYVDGVYQPFDANGSDFNNVQSIEVAKGPQGTLFGRNATGGVVQVRTKNPLDRQGADLEVGYASFQTYTARGYAAVELADNVAIDVAAFFDQQKDGWGTNYFDNSDFYTHKRYGVRSKFVAELTDSFTATISADYANRTSSKGIAYTPLGKNGLLFSRAIGAYTLPTPYDVLSDLKPHYHTEERGGSLTLEKRIAGVKLLSISSHRAADEDLYVDSDASGVFFDHDLRIGKRKSFSQELQASGQAGSFNWVTGLYYYYSRDKADFSFNGPFASLAFGAPAGAPFITRFDDQVNAYAAYAQGTIEFLLRTNLTLGARYTIENRELTGKTLNSPVLSPNSAGTQKATFKEPNYRVALDHRFSPNVMIYGSFTHGFNAGFFNQISVLGYRDQVNPLVSPEKVDAYEIGVKSDLLDRRLRVNIAAFTYDYANLQQQIIVNSVVSTINAASARIKGVDLEITARPVPSLTLSFNANYLDGKYKSYPRAVNYDYAANGSLAAVGARDARGKDIINAPHWSLQGTATHRLATSIGEFTTTATLNYQAKSYAEPQNEFVNPSRTVLDISEQWVLPDGLTSITVWAKNLTNEIYYYSVSLGTPIGVKGNPGAPRTIGITLGRKF